MFTIAILTAPTIYPYHTSISTMLKSTLSDDKYTVSIIDINAYKFDHLCLKDIENIHPDILITLDLSGYGFRTQTGENALNMLYTKNLNLIWGNKPEYAPFLTKKISMSMLFYDVSGRDHHLPTHYPNMLYYKVVDRLTDETSFQNIWTDFIAQTLLS